MYTEDGWHADGGMYCVSWQDCADCWDCVQDWLSSVSSKQAAYHAVAEYYQSMVSKESKEFGEEIARLKVGLLLTVNVDIYSTLLAILWLDASTVDHFWDAKYYRLFIIHSGP